VGVEEEILTHLAVKKKINLLITKIIRSVVQIMK